MSSIDRVNGGISVYRPQKTQLTRAVNADSDDERADRQHQEEDTNPEHRKRRKKDSQRLLDLSA